MAFKPISVTQLSQYVKQIFDAEELLHGIAVVGEISGWSNVRGTAYFSLKDASSALSCVCFVADRFAGFKNGDSVMVIGSVNYYTKTGKLNFNVSKIEYYGENVLYQQFLALKAKLDEKGYFKSEIKKPMPKEIKRIGVVSSEGGAVIQDIINIRTRRNPSVDIVLYPVKVQGVGAEFEIAKGIGVLDNYNVDVIVVARGGGSFEDLMPFNTEVVADAVFKCNKPLVSAVGHETDYTIIDFCSDLRAPTPSAAAELLCEDVQYKKQKLINYAKSLSVNMQRLFNYKNDIFQIDIVNLQKNYAYVFENAQQEVNLCLTNLRKQTRVFVELEEQRLNAKQMLLNKLNPEEVLNLGYAMVKKSSGYQNTIKAFSEGDNIQVKLKDGEIFANVVKVEEN